MTRRLVALVFVVALAASCGSDSAADSTPATVAVDSEPGVAAWQTAPLVDVDGVSFTLSEYVGRPVLVETFATWCSNCRAQLGDTQAAAAELGNQAAVVALSVETDISASDVAAYAADNGFADIRFAVLTPEVLAGMADDFGTTVANPPATPKVIIDATGRAGELSTGPQPAAELIELLGG